MYTVTLQVVYVTVFEPRLITEIEEVTPCLSFKKADTLNTSCVVVSRILKVYENEGKVRINRSAIALLCSANVDRRFFQMHN